MKAHLKESGIGSSRLRYHAAATSTFVFKHKSDKERLIADAREAILERKIAKGKLMGTNSACLKEELQRQYSTLNYRVKRSATAEQRRFVENLATEAKAGGQELDTVYRITTTLV